MWCRSCQRQAESPEDVARLRVLLLLLLLLPPRLGPRRCWTRRRSAGDPGADGRVVQEGCEEQFIAAVAKLNAKLEAALELHVNPADSAAAAAANGRSSPPLFVQHCRDSEALGMSQDLTA